MASFFEDLRVRHRWNQISQNAESATETAAAKIQTFQYKYTNPCLSSMTTCIEKCFGNCLPRRDERAWRRIRGRAEASFDFYDDWDQDDNSRNYGLLGNWGNDELGRLLTGNTCHPNRIDNKSQPSRKRAMSYGTRGRRKSLENDPTVIPSTSALGFLGRLPFKLGGTLRYKPSAADLQDHPGKFRAGTMYKQEAESFLSDDNHKFTQNKSTEQKRSRSSTMSSGETSNSFRSRRDLLPSDEEEDAVPISDEFSLVVERQSTQSEIDWDHKHITKAQFKKSSSPEDSIPVLSPLPQLPSRSKLLVAGHDNITSDSNIESIRSSTPTIVQTPSIFHLQQEQNFLTSEKNSNVKKNGCTASKIVIDSRTHRDESCDKLFVNTNYDNYAKVFSGKEAVIQRNMVPENDDEAETENLKNFQQMFKTTSKSGRSTIGIPSQEIHHQVFVPARLPHFD